MLLTPTLADPPPLVGHLDPTAPYEQIIDRLVDWVAFTPLQNVTGDPAISLPLAESEDGLPIGMMFSARLGRDATLLELAYELEEAAPFRLLAATTDAVSERSKALMGSTTRYRPANRRRNPSWT